MSAPASIFQLKPEAQRRILVTSFPPSQNSGGDRKENKLLIVETDEVTRLDQNGVMSIGKCHAATKPFLVVTNGLSTLDRNGKPCIEGIGVPFCTTVFKWDENGEPQVVLQDSCEAVGVRAYLPDCYQDAEILDARRARAAIAVRPIRITPRATHVSRARCTSRAPRTARRSRATATESPGGDDGPSDPADSDPPFPALLRVQRAAQNCRTLRSLARDAREHVVEVALRLAVFDGVLSSAADRLLLIEETA